MPLVDILHFKTDNEDASYTNNTLLQETVIPKAAPILNRVIKDMAVHDVFFENCFMVADLGCSSGMNALLVASNIIDIVHEVCLKYHKTPELQVYLNDLIGNDFNSVFRLLPDFYDALKKDKGEDFGPCFVSIVPGSFYDRLFPDESLHLVHSSNSLHWLSQVPEGLENNKTNIYMTKTSPLSVLQAYGKQFHTDFTKFLQLRSEEIVCGGRMVLTIPSRSNHDPTSDDSTIVWELLTISFTEMFKEGLVQESDIVSFNFPLYFSHEDEVRNIIQADGSFSLDDMDIIEFYWDLDDIDSIRAITEPLLKSNFDKGVIDVLYKKFGEKVAEMHEEYPDVNKKIRQLSVVVSLNRR